jgi:hypothetical protein
MLRRQLLMDDINSWQAGRVKQAASVKMVKSAIESLVMSAIPPLIAPVTRPGMPVVRARVRRRVVQPRSVAAPAGTRLPRL